MLKAKQTYILLNNIIQNQVLGAAIRFPWFAVRVNLGNGYAWCRSIPAFCLHANMIKHPY